MPERSAGPAAPAGRAVDVVVVGAGPAGLATAVACAERGLETAVVSPSHEPWPRTYGVWADELSGLAGGLGLEPTRLATTYAATVVRTERGGEQRLPRRYARLREGVLHRELTARADSRGVDRVAGSVVSVHGVGGATRVVGLRDGSVLRARVVLDARGALPGTAQQRAWGELVTGGAESLVPPGTALLMDWCSLRTPTGPPVFLYGLPREDGTTLLEATSLAARPPVPLPDLRRMLHDLLGREGLALAGVGPERVAIPLDAPVRSSGPATAVGAAAGMVHPATGFSVAAGLALAPVVAAAIAGGGGRAAAAAQRAVATPRRRTTSVLLAVGREVLLPLDAAATDDFFGAFFELPPSRWPAYLSTESGPAAVAAAMAHVFTAVSPALRLHLVLGSTVAAARAVRAGARSRRHALT